MNNKEVVHSSNNLTDDECSNIKEHKTQHKRTNRNNSFYTLVHIELQLSPNMKNQNEIYDWKITNNHEGELVMAYNTNAERRTSYPRAFYALYIGLNDNGIGHLIFKLSMKQILTTIKYQPVPVPENLFKTINGKDTFITKIQINQFDSDRFIAQDDHLDDTKYDGLARSNKVDNF